jgi:hypothetical protein
LHWRVSLQIAFGSLRSLALAAQFLHAGAYDREIVSSTGSGHVFSSHSLVKIWSRLYGPLVADGTNRIWVNFPG